MSCAPTSHLGRIQDKRAGFTLVEVLVALAISALCLMMLSGIIGRLTTTRKSLRDHAAILDQGDAVFRLLGTLLQSVDVELKDAREPNVMGGAQELTVRSIGPVVLDLDAETNFRLHVIPAHDPADPASSTLALAWTNPTDGSAFDETIATGVDSLQLAYRARKGDDAWARRWSGPVADLALVRATITFASPRGPVPTSAMLAVGSKLPQACVVNALLDRCPQW